MNIYPTVVSNYNKKPALSVKGYENETEVGWDEINKALDSRIRTETNGKLVIAIECYVGVDDAELFPGLLTGINPDKIYHTSTLLKPSREIDEIVYPYVTDDRIFGHITNLVIEDFFEKNKLSNTRKQISEEKGIVLIYGTGASLLADADILIYADMPRWEGQLRFRRDEASNIGTDNKTTEASLQYKRAYFVDWRVCDNLKKELIGKWDYVLDTTIKGIPKMTTGRALRAALTQTSVRPFRVAPFFDPGPWGGQWMKENFDLDRSAPNYAWCFDCVPEENSLLFDFGGVEFETPSLNLVFSKPEELLGETIRRRFGDEFPIRFDFLDTMGGGNLSLQVHPSKEYIREHFGMQYTQDESYYILDALEDGEVYLGFKKNIEPEALINDLKVSQETGEFDADKFVNRWPAKKHDHFLIPAGTIHCSGANTMVLEISATPYIFTFKLWDWGRMGLDGKPRAINIDRGQSVLKWDYDTEWVSENLINRVERINEGDGWIEERTGLHESEFIETRRHWFSQKVYHNTKGNLNVLNLIEGSEAVVESPGGKFEPFIVHYAETFIVPAGVGEYTITPSGDSLGSRCATIKAFVRTGDNNKNNE
jgi:mannose-6-phosphate isomerase class I